MNTISEKIDQHRRHLITGAAVTAAAAQLGILSSANAQSAKAALPLIKPGRTSHSARSSRSTPEKAFVEAIIA